MSASTITCFLLRHAMNCPAPLLSLEQALNIVCQNINPLEGVDKVHLNDACGRILAEPLHAPADIPPFASSAMDGYALRAAEAGSAGGLRVAGTVYAGAPWQNRLAAGSCLRIFTGAPLPEDADAVIIQENVKRGNDTIYCTTPVRAGDHVRPQGDEARRGELMLSAGQRLGAESIGLIASLGYAEVRVKPRPRVALLTTGNELCPLGEPLEPGKIYDSNRHLLNGLLAEQGLEPLDLGIVPDDPECLKQTLRLVEAEADVIITTGGASVGEADWMRASVEAMGQVLFWQVAIKPGKPFLFGYIGKSVLMGLPGNPVAVAVTFRQLVLPGLLRLMGADIPEPLRIRARVTAPVRKQPGRTEFRRAFLWSDEQGELRVSAQRKQGSHQLTGYTGANSFIVLEADSAGAEEGDSVSVELLHYP